MNRIFAIIFSLNLILTPVAFAQGSGDAYREGSGKKGGADFYASQVLSLGSGIIGSTIITKCKLGSMQPSLILYMVGGMAMIAKEVIGGKAQGTLHESKINDLKMVEERMKAGAEGGDYQKEALEVALADEKNMHKMIKGRKTWMLAITTVYTAAAVVAIVEYIVAKIPTSGKTDQAACSPNPAADKFLTKALVFAYTSLMSKSAGSGAIGQYGGMALGLAQKQVLAKFGSLISTTAQSLDKKANVFSGGLGRAITFGASAVLSGVVTGGLAKRQSIAASNVEKLERVLAEFKKNTQTTEGLDTDAPTEKENDIEKPDAKKYEVKKLAEGVVPKYCFSNQSGVMDFSEAGCDKKMSIATPKIDISLNNPSLVAVNQLATDMGNAVAEGNMEKAELAAGAIGAHAARMKDLRKVAEKKLNDHLKTLGEKPVDLEKSIADQVASMQSDLSKAEAAEGVNLAAASKDDMDADAQNKLNDSKIETAAAPAAPSLDLGLGDGMAVEETAFETPTTTASLDESLDQYESTVEDISKKSDVSIFKQVSNRYLLNYTKIFKEKKRLD